MKPIDFPETNRTLVADGCGDLPVFTSGAECISLWSLSWRERLRVLVVGTIWLRVKSGWLQPPVALQVESPFWSA